MTSEKGAALPLLFHPFPANGRLPGKTPHGSVIVVLLLVFAAVLLVVSTGLLVLAAVLRAVVEVLLPAVLAALVILAVLAVLSVLVVGIVLHDSHLTASSMPKKAVFPFILQKKFLK